MELRRYVEHILRGEYDRARVEPPCMPLDDLDQLAESVHDRARRPHAFPPPAHLAVGNGARLVPRRPPGPCGGECTAMGVIAYRWVTDEHLRNLYILHGLAHAVLHCQRGASNDADAWVLTGALSVPPSRMDIARLHPDRPAAHVPLWFVFERLIESGLRKAAGS